MQASSSDLVWQRAARVVLGAGIAVAVVIACSSRDSAGPLSSGSAAVATPAAPSTPSAAPSTPSAAPSTSPTAPSTPPAGAAPDRAAPGHNEGAGGEPPAADAPRPAPHCEDLNVDDAMVQAQNQYTAGFSKAALQLATKALECRQDARMYRLAALYACAAQDVASAKRFVHKVPAQFQPAIIQRCQQQGIAIP